MPTQPATDVSRTRQLATDLVAAALTVLKDGGGQLPVREVFGKVESKVKLDDWARQTYEKSGSVRWKFVLHIYSVDCVKAGFLIKKSGVWYLTPEGENALALNPSELFDTVRNAFKAWQKGRAADAAELTEDSEDSLEEVVHEDLDEFEARGREGIRRRLLSKNAYEFQDLVAALLRGMGYFTPFVSPRGKDGGIDVVAYRDALGTLSPRIKVQVKHTESSTDAQPIRELIGVLKKDGDVGIFISSGGFTNPAKETARSAQTHVELIGLERLLDLWIEYYPKLANEDKSLLPLTPIYFVTPEI